ncbi:MAG: hypothetical protein ACTSU5_02225 [Promethearchaeota archaeon]
MRLSGREAVKPWRSRHVRKSHESRVHARILSLEATRRGGMSGVRVGGWSSRASALGLSRPVALVGAGLEPGARRS